MVLGKEGIVVIGAGLAGLATATRLDEAGIDVTVLEARDRVGGRVWSHRLPSGEVIELGAEFVLPGYELLGQTVESLQLDLYDKGMYYGHREPRGGAPTTADAVDAAATLLASASEGSIAEALERFVDDDGTRAAIAARVAVSTSYDPSDQPASVVARGAAAFGRYTSFGIAGGNDLLAKGLAARLGGKVRLSTRALSVSWGGRGVRVGTAEGEIRCRGVVIATPAWDVDRLHLEPALPDRKARAVRGVRYGQAAKLFLPLATPAPPSAVLSVPGRFWTWTQLAPDGSPLPVVAALVGTREAIEGLGLDRGPGPWATAVKELRPDLELDRRPPVLATWPGGSWSARTLSSPLDDEALAEPVGPLLFAGEHTAAEWYGLMEGALHSGRRAADEARALVSA